ncbi:vitamin K epoxide reductase family protein [Nocardia iowensis]|uniref:Vitamin K epoxide reductase family protein n=1 Tax=Nocardia iowensis TaxID=204891 RepID=A0ABX8RRS1_NOCIO|nr:vitamin K epoxide reductase family protein [Nocardia iowensis]QXN91125.1 vitamin K epoxide reductase family protein [Nocardia iowensis]
MITAPPRAAWILLLGGLAGWLASVALTVERFKLFTDPGYTPSCSINPILSCGSVMVTEQAAVFGFPNPLMGIAGFSVLVTLGVLAVVGVGFPRWIWGGLWLGLALGVGFVCWLIFQSLYRINALCPYCMVVWAIITPLLAVVTDQLWGGSRGPLRVLAEWRWTIVALFYAVVLLLIFLRFQDYWLSLV